MLINVMTVKQLAIFDFIGDFLFVQLVLEKPTPYSKTRRLP